MSHLDVKFPRGTFYTAALGATPVDLSTQSTGAAGNPVYVSSIFVSFLPAAPQGSTVEFRNSADTETFFFARKSSAGGVSQDLSLDRYSFYAAGGLEVVADVAGVADVSVVFFDTGF